MKEKRTALYEVISRVTSWNAREDDIEELLAVMAEEWRMAREEDARLRDCHLCDVGIVQHSEFTELRYYFLCC